LCFFLCWESNYFVSEIESSVSWVVHLTIIVVNYI